MTEPEQPRRRRHLIDPDAPRPVRDRAAEDKNLTRVQRWVMSALVVTTIFHLVMGLILAAVFLEDPRPGARVGLCLIAGAFGVIAVALARMIHGRRPVSSWLLLGLVPSAIGIVLAYR
ncbi:MAG: hypothetical protein JWN68_1342 [Nocardioides sp.]|jgi:DMSO reductase anchor subunit|uniref:hypothetical protein n=1 Tax=Nocardioides sp. TaxID=35761 RepID=UPI002614EB70|nr:hypothetical protein [Nocardioides sp.]MCW2833389.1 hypothetical protein [Nocardioides sp.]